MTLSILKPELKDFLDEQKIQASNFPKRAVNDLQEMLTSKKYDNFLDLVEKYKDVLNVKYSFGKAADGKDVEIKRDDGRQIPDKMDFNCIQALHPLDSERPVLQLGWALFEGNTMDKVARIIDGLSALTKLDNLIQKTKTVHNIVDSMLGGTDMTDRANIFDWWKTYHDVGAIYKDGLLKDDENGKEGASVQDKFAKLYKYAGIDSTSIREVQILLDLLERTDHKGMAMDMATLFKAEDKLKNLLSKDEYDSKRSARHEKGASSAPSSY